MGASPDPLQQVRHWQCVRASEACRVMLQELQDMSFWHRWPAASLTFAFLLGLPDFIKDLIVVHKRPTSLDDARWDLAPPSLPLQPPASEPVPAPVCALELAPMTTPAPTTAPMSMSVLLRKAKATSPTATAETLAAKDKDGDPSHRGCDSCSQAPEPGSKIPKPGSKGCLPC